MWNLLKQLIMQEELIKFETAKLAKEKGFKGKCLKGYLPDGSLGISHYSTYCENDEEDYPTKYAAPTQSLLQKWIREVYNIHIEIIWNSNLTQKYNVQVHTLETFCAYDDKNDYDSYELALEEGIIQALQLLPNK